MSDDLNTVIEIFKEASADPVRSEAVEKAESYSRSAFPNEMSCLTAMDELFQCFSLGGQIRHYYRYGDLTTCHRQGEKLRFCIKTSMLSKDEKGARIQSYYKDRLVDDKKRGSSEDVWQMR